MSMLWTEAQVRGRAGWQASCSKCGTLISLPAVPKRGVRAHEQIGVGSVMGSAGSSDLPVSDGDPASRDSGNQKPGSLSLRNGRPHEPNDVRAKTRWRAP